MRKFKHKREHFTLIEVLIAIVVTVTALVTAYQTMARSRKHVYATRFHVEGEAFAYDVINSLTQFGYTKVPSLSYLSTLNGAVATSTPDSQIIELDSTEIANIYYKPLRSAIQDQIAISDDIDLTPDLSLRSGSLMITIVEGEDTSVTTGTSTYSSKWKVVTAVVSWNDIFTRSPRSVTLTRTCYK